MQKYALTSFPLSEGIFDILDNLDLWNLDFLSSIFLFFACYCFEDRLTLLILSVPINCSLQKHLVLRAFKIIVITLLILLNSPIYFLNICRLPQYSFNFSSCKWKIVKSAETLYWEISENMFHASNSFYPLNTQMHFQHVSATWYERQSNLLN